MDTGPVGRGGIARSVLALVLPVALFAAVAGCSGSGAEHAPPESLARKVWLNCHHADDYHSAEADAAAGLALLVQGDAPERPAGRPLNVLCVSGGGKYAAFTSGVLCGWTSTGLRPTFDVATGISSGAPVALLAFLGAKYDPLLAEIFLNLRRSDLYAWRPVRGIIAGTGLMSSRPLEELLDRQITHEALEEIQAAHAAGRRLFVATANVMTHKMVVWDVGALASSGRPDALELVRKVFLAACSIPGLVPPVEFDVTVNGVRYREYHADAGSLAQIFVRTAGALPPDSAVWILSAGKVHLNSLEGRPRVLESMASTVSAGLYALFRADTMKVYALCGVTRSRFRMLALPRNFDGKANSMMFDRDELHRMFWVGYQLAVGDAWETRPPDSGLDELCPPRAGVEFTAPE